ncbi:MAG TPA: hypothetical protein VGI12_12025 [Vicinamibacterales bacterium]|jgi:hypothetical protein
MSESSNVRLRRKPDARVVEHPSGVTAYPEPYAVPVLPPGWAPLDESDAEAVLHACDDLPAACRLRLGSLWDGSAEYRVYCLHGDTWGGVHAATQFRFGRNCRLLAIAHESRDVARIAIEFANWDLESAGATWRLRLDLE